MNKHWKKAGYKLTLDDNVDQFYVEFHGPKGSLYEGGVWNISVKMPNGNPSEPPILHFPETFIHPNIEEIVCVDVLDKEWRSEMGLVNVFEYILPQLLKEPNTESPLNVEAAELLIKDSAAYEAAVRESCNKTRANTANDDKNGVDGKLSFDENKADGDSPT